jgi:polyisoprenoid-binding protein YceI
LTGVARFGPDTGSLEVHTYREGVAAKVGHDLIIEVESWEGSDEGGTLELTADPRSLRVREGHRGVKPLTDKDRDEIRKTIEAKVLGTQPIAFRSTLVADDAVEGELTIAGATRPVAFQLQREGDRVRATVRVVQSQWGIKPYRGLMGALKVRDDVEVVLDAPAAPG